METLGPRELNCSRRPLDVAVGQAPEVVAACARLALPATIELPGMARAVVAVAVELDGETVLGPAAVDPPAVDGPVGLR